MSNKQERQSSLNKDFTVLTWVVPNILNLVEQNLNLYNEENSHFFGHSIPVMLRSIIFPEYACL
jgi:hypothetical protein